MLRFEVDVMSFRTRVMLVVQTDRRSMPITLAQVGEYLGGVAPIVECPVVLDEFGGPIIEFQPTSEGQRMAELLAAQLTICTAGLWPTPAEK